MGERPASRRLAAEQGLHQSVAGGAGVSRQPYKSHCAHDGLAHAGAALQAGRRSLTARFGKAEQWNALRVLFACPES